MNLGGADAPFCVDIDLGTHTSDFPVHEYTAEIKDLRDIECTLSCNHLSYVPSVEVWSESCVGGSCTSYAEEVSDCGVTKSIGGPGKVVVKTGGFFEGFRLRCTCSSSGSPAATTDPPTPIPATSTGTEDTEPSLFDAARDDPNWPGQTLKPGTKGRLIINVQYDDYPQEIHWTFEECNGTTRPFDNDNNVATETAVVAKENTTLASSNDSFVEGESWVIVEEFVGDESMGDESQLVSYPQAGLSSDIYYRFTIADHGPNGDGICCNWGAKGWVAITGGDEGVLWTLAGDRIGQTPFVVMFYVDENSTVRAYADDEEMTSPIETNNSLLESITRPSDQPPPSTSSQATPERTGLHHFLRSSQLGALVAKIGIVVLVPAAMSGSVQVIFSVSVVKVDQL